MKVIDTLEWSQPEAISEWGQKILPPVKNAWPDYINYYVHPDIVVAVGRLLIPAFVEHEGGVFLQERFTTSGFLTWKEKLYDVTEVEKVINHQHVYDLFSFDDNIAESSYIGVANLMAQTLRIALASSFPERDFNVCVSNTDQDYGPIVAFHSASSTGTM